MHIRFLREPEGRRPLRTPRRRFGVVLEWLIEIYDEVVWTGLIWLRIGTSGRFICNLYGIFCKLCNKRIQRHVEECSVVLL
jgi:hypothetical protein